MTNLDDMLNQTPTLTLEGLEPEKQETTEVKNAIMAPETVAKDVVESMKADLTPEEQKMVDDFAQQIDITNTQQILQYGAGCQKKIADFSETALSNVRTKDMGEIGEMLVDVVGELREFNDDEDSKGFLGFFKKNANKLSSYKAKYDKAEVNVSRISTALEGHQVTLLKDIAMLD